jgi:hemolysin III
LDGPHSTVELRPAWRGRIHSWAFLVSIPAGIWLLALSQRAAARTTVAIYVFSLLAVFGTSAAYHRFAQSVTARRRMRRLDHSMIYVLIAGTFTPVCLLALPPAWGIPLLCAIWVGAVVGIAIQLSGTDGFKKLSNAMYLVMGWGALVGLPAMIHRVDPVTVVLLITGGVFYTVGAILFFLHRPDPAPTVFGFHEVWHTFTVIAGASHFAMIWMLATA